MLGLEHPNTLTSMSNLAYTYGKQGQWTKAQEIEMQVMETRKRVLGLEHPCILISMSNLAWILKGQGHIDKATDLMTEVVALREKKLGIDHPDTKAIIQTLEQWRKQGREQTGLQTVVSNTDI